MSNAIRINEEKSQSWVIAIEAFILGCIIAYNINQAGAHGALSLVLGLAATSLIYFLIVYVSVIFWIWTLGLASVSGYQVFIGLIKTNTDRGWSLFWAAVTTLAIIGIHVKSRIHNQAENTPNRITRIK